MNLRRVKLIVLMPQARQPAGFHPVGIRQGAAQEPAASSLATGASSRQPAKSEEPTHEKNTSNTTLLR